ncbi:hypothetical protein tinsulaeT_37160 [Thalassotalea insulae]|uniref:Uncharacterized protein n=1 Tax=Thalassotalea insulae TaxID=2056778 RepID=A0ABQ6H1S6_9GAMM|nr:hypothetical protein [Thalassotalea insulae]GLX80376.1 hypothetical protein tinsulaeT_37160 [Thalassotalea insulae]
MNKQALALYIGVVLLPLLVVGCSSIDSAVNKIKKVADEYVPLYEYKSTDLEKMWIQSDANSNQNLPTAVDILFIYDQKAADTLSALSGPDWFAQKRALLLKYQASILITALEIVPQSSKQTVTLPDKFYNAISVLMFANYLAPDGQYLADITQYCELKVTLKNKGYILEELNP